MTGTTNQTNLRSWNEAPASWNVKYRVNGFEEQITLRGESYGEIAEQAERAREWVKTHADQKGDVQKPSAAGVNAPAIPTTPQKSAQPQPATQPAANANPLSFEAAEMVATVNAGKTYWKIKGGQFTKFGVTVWPETLKAAGWETDALDPMTVYSLSGWTAHYVEKEGKPDKVIKLVDHRAA